MTSQSQKPLAFELLSRLASAPIVPLIAENDPGRALDTALALREGGLSVIEVVLRSDNALAGLEAIRHALSDALVGAGTVLTEDQAHAARDAGAQFIVSPGLYEPIARICDEAGLPFLPGTATAGDVQRAYALGLRMVKFFPAELAGGIPMLKSFASVFREMRFMPTGGISAENLGEYLSLGSVVACGGSWLTPRDAVASGDFATVTRLARQACDIAARARVSQEARS